MIIIELDSQGGAEVIEKQDKNQNPLRLSKNNV